jgi:hypothetical protein
MRLVCSLVQMVVITKSVDRRAYGIIGLLGWFQWLEYGLGGMDGGLGSFNKEILFQEWQERQEGNCINQIGFKDGVLSMYSKYR